MDDTPPTTTTPSPLPDPEYVIMLNVLQRASDVIEHCAAAQLEITIDMALAIALADPESPHELSDAIGRRADLVPVLPEVWPCLVMRDDGCVAHEDAEWRGRDDQCTFEVGAEWGPSDDPDDVLDSLDPEDWRHDDDDTATTWIHLAVELPVLRADGLAGWIDASRRATLDPVEPACGDGHDHDWEQIRVVGSGGGVIVTYACAHCGARKIVDTWATDPVDGSQGHTSVLYTDPSDD